MKHVPRFLGVSLILALLNVGYLNVALASRGSSHKALTASAVSTFALESALKSFSEPIPEPTPPPHATKADIKQDLDDTKTDLQAVIGTDPNGFAATLLSSAGVDPVEDIDQAKTDLDDISDTDFSNGQAQFDKLHKKFQKRHHNTAAILSNPTLMAMLHRPSPVKFRVVTGNSQSPATETDRPFSPSKTGPVSGRNSKDFSNLRVVVTPELTSTCSPGSGTPTDPVNVLTIAKALTMGTEIIKEGIPEDTMVVPHSIAVVAWGAAKTAEFVLETLHQIYVDCTAVKAGEKTDTALSDIKSSVSNMSSNVSSINSNVNTVKNTVGGINTVVNNTSSKVDTVNTTVNNIDNSVTNITNKLTTINTTVNTTSNNVNTANANITALSELSLRLMIEADLAAPDNSTPVALFVTPGSKGGYLELVRTIVMATIANLAATSAQANSFLAQADAYKAAGNYKAAYATYRKAYKSASS